MSNKQAKRERQRMRAAGETPKCDAKAARDQAKYTARLQRLAEWNALSDEEQQRRIDQERQTRSLNAAKTLAALAMAGRLVGIR